jgi:hypothetical protein
MDGIVLESRLSYNCITILIWVFTALLPSLFFMSCCECSFVLNIQFSTTTTAACELPNEFGILSASVKTGT